MFCEAFKLCKNIGSTDLTMHNLWIQGKPNETALGHVTSGKRFIGQPPKPSVNAGVMLMIIPSQCYQHVDIQQIHALFLG